MTHEERVQLASGLVSILPTAEYDEFAEVLFDLVYESKTPEERDMIVTQLLNLGIDVRPICKKKHPV